ncbi:MAG: YdcH family protein [Alphaproteobacteria bacterium]|nr:YdcH family protein [Alphaproteobacteria bacterium]
MGEDGFDPNDMDAMAGRLETLRTRHRDLDAQIAELASEGAESFRVMALKREKLRVKDQIAWLASRLTPDIIA